MADSLNEAGANVEAARRATLEALAQGNTGAQAAVTLGRQQASGAQQTALSQMAAESAQRGAPAGAQAAQAQIVAPVGQRVDQYLASSGERYAQDMGRMTAANSNYMGQAAAAVPVIRAQADREVGLMREKWEAQKAAEEQEAARFGGYQTAGEYENAVTARAQELQQEALAALAEQSRAVVAEQQQAQRRNVGASRLLELDARSPMRGPTVEGPGTLTRLALPGGASAPAMVPGDRVGVTPARTFAEHQATATPNVNRAGAQAYRDQAGRATQNIGAVAGANRQGRADITDPRNLFEFQRQAAIDDFGADPYDAVGRFAPMEPGDQLGMARDDRDWQAYQQSGGQFLSYDEMVRAQQPEEQSYPRSVQRIEEAGARLGVEPETFEQIATHPSYAQAISVIEAMLNDEELDGATVPWSAVEDVLSQMYAEDFGHDFPIQRQLLREMYASEFR